MSKTNLPFLKGWMEELEPFKWSIFQLVIKSCFGFLGYKISAAVIKAQYLIKDLLYHYTLHPGTRRNMLGDQWDD